MEKKIKRERTSTTKTEILNVLISRKSALSHKDFQDFFENTIDRVTIYRALDRLVLEGKLHKIANFDGVIQYALCSECDHKTSVLEEENKHHNHNHEHVHFNCLVCKETTCIENVIPKIEISNEYQVKETQILLNGICKKCNV
ncbi:Fur family transcriptional regulator [Flavobacterium difficile]|uniref:Fur family transcriptional regulator n=1 Tax=Flavobacterium difficile TaxID=2709659 RepID=A0ABX0I3X8_9FLAO|nr:Fur family transcriptional regulator [Flavobacterium difficile]NHM01890.1 Fur family transcriptional regulator [Flavobacterium difficile]